MGTLGGIPLEAGDVLAKKYRLEKLVGEGGTGVVVAATHVQLEQRVAIKFLRSALASEEVVMRFEREARAISKIQSEHVVLVLDVGVDPAGTPYMVMEFLDGRDLARILKDDGPLAIEDAVDCMLQVCEALGEAHATGIVHRDLKPANLFVTRRDDGGPHVKVVDFGISKIVDKKLLSGERGPKEMTGNFEVLGSPRYMAPEQLRNSKDVDFRADLWSAGAVLFQLVTGKHAFDAESNTHASLRVLTSEPENLRTFAPHAPPRLEEIVKRCLTKDVTKRFQSARELASALSPLASERTKDSLARMRSTHEEPNLDIALDITSVIPPSVEPAPVPALPKPPPVPAAAKTHPPLAAPGGVSPLAPRIPSSPPAAPSSRPSRPRASVPSPIPTPRPSGRRPAAPSDPSSLDGSTLGSLLRSPSRSVKLAVVALGLVAVFVVFGVMTALKVAVRSAAPPGAAVTFPQAPTIDIPSTVVTAPPARPAVPLDAGRASP